MPKRAEISSTLWSELNNSTKYMVEITEAVNTGKFPPSLIPKSPGPLTEARWITHMNTNLRKYCQTSKPTADHKKLVEYDVKIYAPWHLRIRMQPHITMGSAHLHWAIKTARSVLSGKPWKEFQRSIRFNSYFCHPEAIILYMLAHSSPEVRGKAVNFIQLARKFQEKNKGVRVFKAPGIINNKGKVIPPNGAHMNGPGHFINWAAEEPQDLLFWEHCLKIDGYVTEPPLTMHLKDSPEEPQLQQIVDGSLDIKSVIPNAKCHSQSIEKIVPTVTEASRRMIGHFKQRGFIFSLNDSWETFGTRTTKTDFIEHLKSFQLFDEYESDDDKSDFK